VYFCNENNHNTVDCRAIAKFNQQKNNKAHLEAKDGLEKKCLTFLFEKINAFKRQLKPEKTANSKKRNAESILSIEIYFTTSSDEDTSEEYLFTSSIPFSSSKTKLSKIISPNKQSLSCY
jgi:hypothetical protein